MDNSDKVKILLMCAKRDTLSASSIARETGLPSKKVSNFIDYCIKQSYMTKKEYKDMITGKPKFGFGRVRHMYSTTPEGAQWALSIRQH